MSKKFKYLAIGDSISQGFNSKVGSATFGEKRVNDVFRKGFSYCDYLVEYIHDYLIYKHNRNDAKCIDFWNNFEYCNSSLSVARILDYTQLLKNQFDPEFIEMIKLNNTIQKISNLDYHVEDFWNFNNKENNKETYQELSNRFKDAIKEANLITISIGGNEYESSMPFHLFRLLLVERNLIQQREIKEKLFAQINSICQKITQEYIEFVKLIKTINPNVTLILITYNPPFLPFFLSYEKILKKRTPAIFGDFFKRIIVCFNDVVQTVAKETNSLWTRTFSLKTWAKAADKLWENTIDVHPTELGYQEIARKVFLTLLNSKSFEIFTPKKSNPKVRKFNLKNNKLISKNNASYFENVLKMPMNTNRIVYIFRVWLEQNKQLQNPYFALAKKTFVKITDSQSETQITSRVNYSSLSAVIIENILSIIRYLPTDSELHKAFLNFSKEDDYIIKCLLAIFNTQSIIDLIDSVESLYRTHPKISLSKFLNMIFIKNEKTIFNLIKGLSNNKQGQNFKWTNIWLDAFYDDFKNHKPIRILNEKINTFWYHLTFDDNVAALIKELVSLVKGKLTKILEYQTFDHMLNSLIIENSDFFHNLLRAIIDFSIAYISKNKGIFAYTLLSLMNIKIKKMSNRDWIKLEKLITKILPILCDQDTKKIMVKTIYSVLEKMRIWPAFNFDKNPKKSFIKILIKDFGKLFIKFIFKKENRKLMKVIMSLVKYKFGWKLKHLFN
ncbi:Uncharacterised protein [Metamycoplasma arthritidis]|uniref:SGNH/GDSL hydrolase family protein n=1 Tax=Metamycoplasma arthritidis TaxID=2111 RepID=UPI0010052074|nr:SGNH/GDSL hydrolase family protein [Metamycoplasma arthritidis]VEU78928.1 Uncharacterised protein [Metamycoplasma arthritidis]